MSARTFLFVLVVSLSLSGSVEIAAQNRDDRPAKFVFDGNRAPKNVKNQKMEVAVQLDRKFRATRRVKLIVAPTQAPDLGYIQAAVLLGSRPKRTVFLGQSFLARGPESFTVYLVSFPKKAHVPKEGEIKLDEIEDIDGAEIEDSFEIKRLK